MKWFLLIIFVNWASQVSITTIDFETEMLCKEGEFTVNKTLSGGKYSYLAKCFERKK